MKIPASIFCATALAITAMTPSAFAADAVIGSETTPVPEDFDTSRFYVSVFGGVSFLDDIDLSGNVITPAGNNPQTVELDFDTGYTIGAAVGKSFGDIGNGFILRGEIELSYSEQDIDQIFFSGNGPAAEINVGGDFSSTNLLVNGLLDLPELGDGLFTPYIGAGIGVAFSELDAVYGPGVRLDNDEENFIAQGIIGASFAATENTDLFVEGRYSRIFNFETPRFNPAGGLTGVIEDDVDTYGINFGLRFKL